MIIEDCKHCEHYVTDACGDKVCAFDGDCENYVQTNEEYLRSCNTEQLAGCISDITCNCWGCKRIYVEDCPNYAKYKACFCDKEDVLEWLKQPHQKE